MYPPSNRHFQCSPCCFTSSAYRLGTALFVVFLLITTHTWLLRRSMLSRAVKRTIPPWIKLRWVQEWDHASTGQLEGVLLIETFESTWHTLFWGSWRGFRVALPVSWYRFIQRGVVQTGRQRGSTAHQRGVNRAWIGWHNKQLMLLPRRIETRTNNPCSYMLNSSFYEAFFLSKPFCLSGLAWRQH
jgi:hypothetical protein